MGKVKVGLADTSTTIAKQEINQQQKELQKLVKETYVSKTTRCKCGHEYKSKSIADLLELETLFKSRTCGLCHTTGIKSRQVKFSNSLTVLKIGLVRFMDTLIDVSEVKVEPKFNYNVILKTMSGKESRAIALIQETFIHEKCLNDLVSIVTPSTGVMELRKGGSTSIKARLDLPGRILVNIPNLTTRHLAMLTESNNRAELKIYVEYNESIQVQE